MRMRLARPQDGPALDRVCVLTGSAGDDASGLFRTPTLLADIYLRPYLAYSPELALVLTDDADEAVGYVVGVADTAAFEAWCETSWWPPLRERFPLGDPETPAADARLVERLHHPSREDPVLTAPYPAHLHVDLLPQAQGGGHGRRLLEAFFEALRARDIPGVHLGVGAANTRARGFYEHLGFEVLEEDEGGALLGLRLG